MGKRKRKSAPLPERHPAEVARQARGLPSAIDAPAAGPQPSEAPRAAAGGRGAGEAGEGVGADVVAVYEGGTVTREQLQEYVRDKLGGISLSDIEGPEETKLQYATSLLAELVIDEVMLKDAESKGLGQREGVQQALRRLSEDENIADLAERVGARVEVSSAEIAAYYQKHREHLNDVPLAQLQGYIRQILIREKARAAFDAYLDRQKALAAIQRRFSLADDAGADASAALFTVNGKAYTVGQWREELLRMTPEERSRCTDPKARERALESLVTRTLLLDAAGTIADEGLRKRLEQIRRMLLIETLHYEEVDRQVRVADAEVTEQYERVKQRWSTVARARLSVAAVPAGRSDAERGKATEVAGRLRKAIADGAGFTAAAEPLKADLPGIQVNEKSRWVSAAEHVADLFQPCAFHTRVFQTLAVGELSEPFLYGADVCVVKVLEREDPRTPKQGEIGGFLKALIWSSKRKAADERYLSGVLDRAKLKVHRDALAGMVRPPLATEGGQGAMTSAPLGGNAQ